MPLDEFSLIVARVRSIGSVPAVNGGAQAHRLLLAVRNLISLFGAACAIAAWAYASRYEPSVSDAHAYWVATLSDPYAVSAMGAADAYHYSPAFLWLIEPIRLLPWQAFHAAWEGIIILALVWLVGLELMPLILLSAFLQADWAWGNIMVLTGAAIVAGFRWPALWAFPLLTKVSPGIGLLWFAFRREWRMLALALGATGAIAALGILIAPVQGWQWFIFLAQATGGDAPNYAGPPLAARVLLAVPLLWWGARENRRWTVPAAALLASPMWGLSFGLVAGIIGAARRTDRP